MQLNKIIRINKKQDHNRKCTLTIKIQLSYKKKDSEKMNTVENSHKKVGVAVLIIDKIDFRARNINRDSEEILIKG